MKAFRLKAVGAAAALALAWSSLAGAQAWPSKPIRWIVPYTPAGITDTGTRMVLQKVQENARARHRLQEKKDTNSSSILFLARQLQLLQQSACTEAVFLMQYGQKWRMIFVGFSLAVNPQ